MRTAPKLKKAYNTINRKHFGGKLPKKIAVCWSKRLNRLCLLGRASNFGDGIYSIELLPVLKKYNVLAEMILIHEMVHILNYTRNRQDGGHGPNFQKEMVRLAKAGAFRKIW